MNLKSTRLQTVFNLLDENKCLADIGCDHGLLSIKYAIENYPTTVYAIDEKEKPLASCKENIIEYSKRGCPLDNVRLICSSGFRKITGDVKQIAIAGVGGDNIIDMFKENKNSLENIDTFVFQPNNNSYFLRRFMNNNSYRIIQEIILEEDGVIYEIIKYGKGKELLNEKELFFGPFLLKEKGDIFIKKYQKEVEKLQKIFNQIPDTNVSDKQKIKDRIDFIKEVL